MQSSNLPNWSILLVVIVVVESGALTPGRESPRTIAHEPQSTQAPSRNHSDIRKSRQSLKRGGGGGGGHGQGEIRTVTGTTARMKVAVQMAQICYRVLNIRG